MLTTVKNLLRTLAFLRHPECLEGLAELAAEVRLRKQVMREHSGVVIEKEVVILGYAPERFTATRTRISRGTVLSFGDHVTGYGKITIGSDTWIGQSNNLRASDMASIAIGKDCLISQFCTLVASNHQIKFGSPIRLQSQSQEKLGVILGDDVWLGVGVTVLPGVSIGSGAVIGAGSVVTKNVPENEIWAGVPAAKIGQRQERERDTNS
jgi:acetyltransferase-like isoleucine patch superfamily enzyme